MSLPKLRNYDELMNEGQRRYGDLRTPFVETTNEQNRCTECKQPVKQPGDSLCMLCYADYLKSPYKFNQKPVMVSDRS
jgi:hypothetical protein